MKHQKGGAWTILLFLMVLLFGSYLLGTTLPDRSATDPSERFIIESTQEIPKKDTVQIGDVQFQQLTPTPDPAASPSPTDSAITPTPSNTPTPTP